jgi:hypothetical protein
MERLDQDVLEDWFSLSESRYKGDSSFRRGIYRWQDCLVHLDVSISQAKNERSSICLLESKRVKKHVFWELAYQQYVMERLGLKIDHSYVLYFNKHYRKAGRINPHELLILADVSEEVAEFVPLIAEQLERMKQILAGPEPVLMLESYQDKDIACSLQSDCYQFPADHPATLHAISPAKLVKMNSSGYRRIREVPDYMLNTKGKIQKRALIHKKPYLEKKAIEKKLAEIVGPVSALDFEAFSPMIPLFEGDGVHLPIVCQCSVAYEEQGATRALSYIYQGEDDPRDGIVSALPRLMPSEGAILVYNQNFERARLRELEMRYPEHKDFLKSLQQRLVDLLPLFASFLVYHPDQKGSTTLKSVAGAFLPGSYESASVKNGKMAQDLYERYREEKDEAKREQIISDLEIYGQWDAKVLIDLYGVLKRLI